MSNLVQDFLAYDERTVSLLPEVFVSTAIPLSAQIGIENAARQRFMERTGKTVPLLVGGTADPVILATLCEGCGEAEGKAYEAPYTKRPVHLCTTCAKEQRTVAEQVNTMFGWNVCRYTLVILPSRK